MTDDEKGEALLLMAALLGNLVVDLDEPVDTRKLVGRSQEYFQNGASILMDFRTQDIQPGDPIYDSAHRILKKGVRLCIERLHEYGIETPKDLAAALERQQ